MNLRPYQTDCLTALDQSFDRVDRALMTLPTGTGKTCVFASYIDILRDRGVVTPSSPALILAHREELLDQAKDKLLQIDSGMRVGIEAAQRLADIGDGPFGPRDEVIVASVQTLGRDGTTRLSEIKPSLIIVDEAHHVAAKTYQNILKRYDAYHGACKVLGCTATPKRLDKQALHTVDGATFEEVAYTYTILQAIADGYLCQIRGYRVRTDVNLDSVRTTAGDWNDADLAKAVDNEKRTKAAISRWREVCESRKTIVFCVDIAHAHHAAEMWRCCGIEAKCVHGGMHKDERAEIMDGYRRERFQVLTNVDIATEGFDDPATSSIVMLRPTQSWGRYCQAIGRGTRICERKEDLIVIDVVDNCRKHSLVTVPAILDLPPGLNLKGKTLEEAAKKLERLGGAGGALLEKINPKDIDEVDSLLERVDLLANVETPPDILSLTRNAWLALPGGGYFLSCGTDKATESPLELKLSQDAIGLWHAQATGKDKPATLGADLSIAFKIMDDFVKSTWPDAGALVSRHAGWRTRQEPPTDKQVNMLRRLGYRPDALPNLTKGLASNLISQGKARV